jgi:hypothetical protein
MGVSPIIRSSIGSTAKPWARKKLAASSRENTIEGFCRKNFDKTMRNTKLLMLPSRSFVGRAKLELSKTVRTILRRTQAFAVVE